MDWSAASDILATNSSSVTVVAVAGSFSKKINTLNDHIEQLKHQHSEINRKLAQVNNTTVLDLNNLQSSMNTTTMDQLSNLHSSVNTLNTTTIDQLNNLRSSVNDLTSQLNSPVDLYQDCIQEIKNCTMSTSGRSDSYWTACNTGSVEINLSVSSNCDQHNMHGHTLSIYHNRTHGTTQWTPGVTMIQTIITFSQLSFAKVYFQATTIAGVT